MTAKPIVPSERATNDIDEAVSYYQTSATEAQALKFIGALEDAFQHISQFPLSGSTRYAHEVQIPELRSWPVKGFRYLVFYAEREITIAVHRVLQTARDIPESLTEGLEG